ncbi:hypothetical protein S7335_328 [Synechococcus sp. PCC 7335]|nr:hypothetical protein S7335_328 [Synechococcus sp. PCC 7335]
MPISREVIAGESCRLQIAQKAEQPQIAIALHLLLAAQIIGCMEQIEKIVKTFQR